MNNDRFVTSFDDLILVTDKGELKKEELLEYLKKRKEETLTFKENLEKDDVVVLKTTNDIVKIIDKNQNFYDYIGKQLVTGDILYFNQENIEKKLKK